MKHVEMCEKRIIEANEHLAWFDSKFALIVYSPEEIIEHKKWWSEDRDWWQRESDREVENESQSKSQATTKA